MHELADNLKIDNSQNRADDNDEYTNEERTKMISFLGVFNKT